PPTFPSDAEGAKPEAAGASGQQVTLRVKLFEVSADKLRAVHWEIDTSVIVGLVAKSGKPTAGRSSFAVATVDEGKRQELWKKLEAVEALKVLSEPLLVTVSGRPAWMNSGGEVPVLVRDSSGAVSI